MLLVDLAFFIGDVALQVMAGQHVLAFDALNKLADTRQSQSSRVAIFAVDMLGLHHEVQLSTPLGMSAKAAWGVGFSKMELCGRM